MLVVGVRRVLYNLGRFGDQENAFLAQIFVQGNPRNDQGKPFFDQVKCVPDEGRIGGKMVSRRGG